LITEQDNSPSESREFTVYYCKDEVDGGYSGRCAELPGAISQGETLEELKANMKDAIRLILESIKAEEADKEKMVIEVRA
jgi:predicted RNase H-like HicB family nuclease